MDDGTPVGDPTGANTLTAMGVWVATLETEYEAKTSDLELEAEYEAKTSDLGIVSATGDDMADASRRCVLEGTERPHAEVASA